MTIAGEGNRIDSHTALYGVIGDPIRHSKSPIMMNRAFRETGINGAYMAFHVTNDRLSDFIAGIRAMGVRGVNVTIPHKLDVMAFLDEIDDGARALGAVNTIVNDNGRLIGYNTDGIGYVRSLKEEAASSLESKRIVVIGAGGAARGIVFALSGEKPGRMTIVNRSVARASELAEAFSNRADIAALPPEQLQEACSDADIVINTTMIGMFPNTDASPLDASWLKPGTVVSDIVYNPLKTKLLQEAEERGCIIHGGLGMFVYQGAYAFEYWTGRPAPTAAMREVVTAALLGQV
ncbi:shikimate dehydrogenase [Paenibacillus harenae]|uniref:Shikimate dehydrogenase (NADP(+)) n=1 Tax=Paenibacillus harenae TaxID=306543 RepID=A0ABT9TZA0_PAEHA|nr:shikimate dehydrogenase [Paenibacillus harenae]MDQ0112711.1 shikimate dehydrogenase [Paenibacillus harenae]